MFVHALRRTAGVAALACAALAAHAAESLKVIIPTPPGGGTDLYFRILAKEAEQILGEPVVILNVPGAGGTIGIARMVSATPDGQTVAGVWVGPVTVTPNTMKVPYTPADYIPIIQVSSAPYVICVHPDFPAKEVIGRAGVAALAHHRVQARSAQRWILRERFGNEGPVRLDHRRPHRSHRRHARLREHAPYSAVMHA